MNINAKIKYKNLLLKKNPGFVKAGVFSFGAWSTQGP
jgi:hypothetical protein